MSQPLEPVAWTVTAQNLPEHARNPIHTDAGAQASGFPRALVAGVTTYAYLTHPILVAWGVDWVRGGGAEVRFRSPVFEGDVVRCEPMPEVGAADGAVVIGALVDDGPRARATVRAVPAGGPPRPRRAGERLPARQFPLGGEWSDEYASRAGDDLALCTAAGVVHPAVWPAIANNVFHSDLARGSWIHTRSTIRHHGLAPVGAVATVHAVVVERFERSGERAIVDLVIEVDGDPVATIEHEAIIALPGH